MLRKAIMGALMAALTVAPASACNAGMSGKDGAAVAGPIRLAANETVVPLRLAATAERPIVVIEGLAFDAPPRLLYEVQLQRRDGRRAPLGTLNFYDRTAPGYGADAGTTRRFDAGEALRALGGAASALVFVPSSGVVGTAPLADAAAGVRFDAVRLQPR